MERTTTRNVARNIESKLLNKIAMIGVSAVAEMVGVDKSQISRWKENLIPRMSMLLAVLEWGIEDDEMAELARRVAAVLAPNETAPECLEHFEA